MTSTLQSIPDVLHIGFSKCGSSYLRSLFRALPSAKLVWKSGFFTPDLYTPNKNRPTSLAEYQGMFARGDGILNVESDEHLAMPSVHPVLGIRATNLQEFERLVRSIATILPSVKIIMVFRNQPSLLVSRYSEYLIAGGTLEFNDFMSTLIGKNDAKNDFFQNFYRQMIEILERNFSKNQLLIIAQEEMATDMAMIGLRIVNFLGIRHPVSIKPNFLSERKSLSVGGMQVLRIINKLLVSNPSFAGAPPCTKCPTLIYRNMVRGIRILDLLLLKRLSQPASSIMSEENRLYLLSHFREDNLRLKDVVKLDLAAMGYIVESNVRPI